MQARRAARELAFILFSQFDKKITQYNQTEFEDIILKSVRTLTNNAIDELKEIAKEKKIKNYSKMSKTELEEAIKESGEK